MAENTIAGQEEQAPSFPFCDTLISKLNSGCNIEYSLLYREEREMPPYLVDKFNRTRVIQWGTSG
ncbi:hypothetical protein E1B28_013277 [Marasmius oreades]|uniref:Uncharacterized protein n=1 Tax=Marasmius oreades TaxID=181124 RepID=A0A9P7RP90_9AGAR|nr:uncharacterized protein E1B28_013277 [Marasmius oreades]KAG7087299.1 hypothetical protein E1B28_013277 [Marasmius oreades]